MNTWKKLSRAALLSLSFSLFGAMGAGQARADIPAPDSDSTVDGADDIAGDEVTSESEEALSSQPGFGRRGCFRRCDRELHRCVHRSPFDHSCRSRFQRCVDRCRFIRFD